MVLFACSVATAGFTAVGGVTATGAFGLLSSIGSLGCLRPFSSFESLIAAASLLKSLVMIGRALLMQK